ncbi:cupin domain-containing protein [Iodobacter violaceini]|nr:cupin domain-containing protein [Iodobacter violacea]
MKIIFSIALAAVLLLNVAHAENKPAIQMDTLLKSSQSWDGKKYDSYPSGPPELTVLKITIPPNTTMAWHKHSMPNVAYVVSGSLTVEKKVGGEKKIITSGQVLPEMVGEYHRGITGKEPVELIVSYAGSVGMPLSEPENNENKDLH